MIKGLALGLPDPPTKASTDSEYCKAILKRMLPEIKGKLMYAYTLCRPDLASLIVPIQHEHILRDECEVYDVYKNNLLTTLNYLISTENIGFHHNFSQVFRRWEEPAEDQN